MASSDVEVLQYSLWETLCLICKLQTHGCFWQRMCKEFFIEYLGHNVDARVKVAECFCEVHHADGDRDDGASWIVSLDRQKVSNYFHNGVTPVVTSSSISGQWLPECPVSPVCVCTHRSRFFTWWSLGVVKLLHILLEVYLLIETRQRSSAWARLVENTNRTKSVFVLL